MVPIRIFLHQLALTLRVGCSTETSLPSTQRTRCRLCPQVHQSMRGETHPLHNCVEDKEVLQVGNIDAGDTESLRPRRTICQLHDSSGMPEPQRIRFLGKSSTRQLTVYPRLVHRSKKGSTMHGGICHRRGIYEPNQRRCIF